MPGWAFNLANPVVRAVRLKASLRAGSCRSVSSLVFALLTEDNAPASSCRTSTWSLVADGASPVPANARSSLAALPLPPLDVVQISDWIDFVLALHTQSDLGSMRSMWSFAAVPLP